MSSEVIIVVPRNALFDNERLVFQGVTTDKNHVQSIMDNIAKAYGTMVKKEAETNTLFKQPIPYAVIRRGDEIFMYERLSGGGEARLYNKLSIGVGGHMNHEDALDFWTLLMKNTERELNEELVLPDAISARPVGLINDDSDDVGKVHIGILLIVDIPSGADVEVREKDKLSGKWVTLDKLTDTDAFERLENWSKMVANHLKENKA